MQAPKFRSNMIESVISAVILDSHKSLEAVRGVLRRLGLLQVLEHIVWANIDMLHPVSRLYLWAPSWHGGALWHLRAPPASCALREDGWILPELITRPDIKIFLSHRLAHRVDRMVSMSDMKYDAIVRSPKPTSSRPSGIVLNQRGIYEVTTTLDADAETVELARFLFLPHFVEVPTVESAHLDADAGDGDVGAHVKAELLDIGWKTVGMSWMKLGLN
ncbi:hypothetical protein B0H11DRAFT_2343029 [Mycena galericulata]|nr:hypothetical protein B0H11DRAFT_2343029 [Mycena galericulata]